MTYSRIAKQNGFSKLEQFPESMVRYYVELCEKIGVKWTQNSANKVYALGWQAVNPEIYRKTAKLLPGAEETLDFILGRGDEMILCTKGNDLLQNAKIDALNLKRWCSQFYIVPKKEEATFKEIVGERKKENCYSVGDSDENDIKPARSAGINAIWIPYGDDVSEMAAGEQADEKKLFVFKELLGIKRNYDKL
jgi:FMN phosphatase YigB (HAD superfamily)